MDALEKMLGLLTNALRDSFSRETIVVEFLQCYFENELFIMRSVGQDAVDILAELAWDLNFYVADPARRAQDPSYYGDERLVSEIAAALRRLSQVGVTIRDR
jgi:hypothetical protein